MFISTISIWVVKFYWHYIVSLCKVTDRNKEVLVSVSLVSVSCFTCGVLKVVLPENRKHEQGIYFNFSVIDYIWSLIYNLCSWNRETNNSMYNMEITLNIRNGITPYNKVETMPFKINEILIDIKTTNSFCWYL